jgi:hypothetical protein
MEFFPMFHWNIGKGCLTVGFHKGERSCSFSLEILSDYSPSSPRAESIAQDISLPAGSDNGYSPLTSTAFFEKKAAQKSFYTRVRLNERYLLMNDDTQ